TVVALVYLLVRKRGGSWRNLGFVPPRVGSFLPKSTRWFGFGAMVLIGYVASIAFVDTYVVAVDLLGLDWLLPGDQIPDESYSNTYVLVALAIAIVIMAPLAEEIFFRAFLFGGLRARWRLVWAALVSGFVFSLAHGDPGLVLPFTGVGVIFALLYERSNSIYTSMAVHFVFNAVSFTLLVATNT
ncbi:MAG TPA: CPBP family intramembrane glutamic endopeptidase, partial [Dehalococcoidia bacterium]|nr:CPBP family intramembrane glutamic endopeptidase [Dehalococcoidia bacterium]